MISPYKIRWNEIVSTDIPFDIITQCSFDEDSGDSETFLGRDAVVSETYNGAMKKGSTYKWNESFAPTITILKKDFSDFTREENRYILSWLTSKQMSGFLDVYTDDSDVIEYSILGNWTSVSQYKLGNSRIVGYVCQFTALTPYAFSRLHKIEKDMSNPESNTITIDVSTDEPESAIYPRITIKQYGSQVVQVNQQMITGNMWIVDDWMDGTVYYYADADEYYYYKHNEDGSVVPTITYTQPNLSTTSVIVKNTYKDANGDIKSTILKIANNKPGETVVIDGANRVVCSYSSTGESTGRIFGDDFIDWSWLPMYNGENKIEVIGNCNVTFEYREVRKVGEI